MLYCDSDNNNNNNNNNYNNNNNNNNNNNSNNNNNNNNNHFILGRSVSPSKWTHCGEGFSPLWGGRVGHAYHSSHPIPAFPHYAVKTLHPGIRTAGKHIYANAKEQR